MEKEIFNVEGIEIEIEKYDKEDSDAERRKIAYAFKAIREESGMSRNNFFIARSLSLQIDCRQEKDHAFRSENLKSSWGFMKREMLLRSEIN